MSTNQSYWGAVWDESRAFFGEWCPLHTEVLFKDGSLSMYYQDFPEEVKKLNADLAAKSTEGCRVCFPANIERVKKWTHLLPASVHRPWMVLPWSHFVLTKFSKESKFPCNHRILQSGMNPSLEDQKAGILPEDWVACRGHTAGWWQQWR